MNYQAQKLHMKTTKYRVVIVDHYNGRQFALPDLHDSWDVAQEAAQAYFAKNKPQTVTDYDIGGYIERVILDLAVNPKTEEAFDEPTDS